MEEWTNGERAGKWVMGEGLGDPETTLGGALRGLLAAVPGLPNASDLGQEMADAEAAQERGYYLPDEDERLFTCFG